MALAFIKYEDARGHQIRFRVDIGKNCFYSYAIGDGEPLQRSDGIKMLRNRTFTSQLFGPLTESARGRTTLEVPHRLFDREHRAIQLMSFRTAEGKGPSISEIIRVPVDARAPEMGDLPVLSFTESSTRSSEMGNGFVDSVPFQIRERPPVSQAFFLGALKSLVPKILPAVLPAIGKLFGGGVAAAAPGGISAGGSGAGAAPTTTTPAPPGSVQIPPQISQLLQSIGNPQTAGLIASLLQQLFPGMAAAVPAGNGAPPPNTPAAPAKAASFSTMVYGEQMAFPIAAVAAALPALMPLLEKVLTPETMKGLMDMADPNKLLGTITNGLVQLGNLGLQGDKEFQEHLRKLNPGVDDPALDRLLEGMSLNLSTATAGLSYRRVESVKLHFADLSPQIIQGRSRLSYRHNADLEFPLSVETARPINDAVLQLSVKDSRTLKVLSERKYRVAQATTGRLSVTPKITRAQLSGLKQDEDYLVCAALVWKKKSGEKIGANLSQLITLVGEFSFDRIEESSKLIPLNDVVKFREFWHRAWQGSFSAGRKRLVFDCKYYYALDNHRRDANARMETVTKLEEGGVHKEVGRLKTGMLISPGALNRLIPTISDRPALNEAELSALGSPGFANRFNQAARAKVKFSGRAGDSAALWVYPEVKMQKIILKRAEQVSGAGHVFQFSEREVYFPMPMLIHFIGASTQA